MSRPLYLPRHSAAALLAYRVSALLAVASLVAFVEFVIHNNTLLLLCTLLAGPLALVMFSLAKRSPKIFRTHEDVFAYIEERHEPLFLFLREFCSDGVYERGNKDNSWNHEEIIGHHFLPYGTIVAIGRPDDKFPIGAAFRIYVEGAAWQDVVGKLIRRADMILLRCGASPGVSWEIEQIIAQANLERLLFFPSFTGDQSINKNVATYQRLSKLVAPPRDATPLEDAALPPEFEAEMRERHQVFSDFLNSNNPQLLAVDPDMALLRGLVESTKKLEEKIDHFRLSQRLSNVELYCIRHGRVVPVPGELKSALEHVTQELNLKRKR